MVFPILWYRLRIHGCFFVFVVVVGTDANSEKEAESTIAWALYPDRVIRLRQAAGHPTKREDVGWRPVLRAERLP